MVSSECAAKSTTASEAAGVSVFSFVGVLGSGPFLMFKKLHWLGFLQLVIFISFLVTFVLLCTTISITIPNVNSITDSVTDSVTGEETNKDNDKDNVKFNTTDKTVPYAIATGISFALMLLFWLVAIVLTWLEIKKCNGEK